MRTPSSSSGFFSSLKQVEKRLKLEVENPTQNFTIRPPPPPPPPKIQETHTSTESLGTPLFLHIDNEPNNSCSLSLQESSQPPSLFLSSSLQCFPTNQNLPPETLKNQPKTTVEAETSDFDDIEQLMQLLGLSNFEEEDGRSEAGRESGECDGRFYEQIVGVKGPKCRNEVERLERWIRYFSRSDDGCGDEEQRREPLRLAFLLLGKAACELEGFDGGFGGLEFPSCIEEFLKFDPPNE